MLKAMVGVVGLFFTLNVSADTICTNGTATQTGAAFFQMAITEDSLQFAPYESAFTVPLAEVLMQGETHIIANQPVTYSSKGVDTAKTLDAMITMSADQTTAQVVLSYDKGPFSAYSLTCSLIQEPL